VARLAVLVEDRQVDPAEVGAKAGAPEDVLDFDDLPVLQERLSALDADDARKTLDSLLARSFFLRRTSGSPPWPSFEISLRPIRVSTLMTRCPTNRKTRKPGRLRSEPCGTGI
jgi:hypothetical protein